MNAKKITLIFLMIIFPSAILAAISAAPVSAPAEIQQTLNTLYQKYKTLRDGKNADYIPALAKVNPDYFGIAVMTVDGKMYAVGDADIAFPIESISKPFVYALALADQGEEKVTREVGLNPTGHKFNSVIAIEERPDHLQNPLVNAGAIQVTSLINGKDSADKWQRVFSYMQSLSDGKLSLGQEVYQSEMNTNQHNRAIAELLASYGMLQGDPDDAVDRYTKACSVMVTAKQLALMGAVLANNGVNPITHQRLMTPKIVRDVLSEMTMNGLYDNSGTWWWMVGLPSKSGVGGSILSIAPNKMAIVVYSPPLDESGNSVRSQAVIRDLSNQYKLHLFDENYCRGRLVFSGFGVDLV